MKNKITSTPKGQKTVLQAVDFLTRLAELDPEEVKEQAKQGRAESGALDQEVVDGAKESLRVVYGYLRSLFAKREGDVAAETTEQSVRSIVTLAKEAADHLDSCRGVFQRVAKGDLLSETEELKSLFALYQSRFAARFEEALEGEEAWQETFARRAEAADVMGRGMKNLEVILRDRDYELFQILNDDGTPFYNQNVARHIQLVAGFDHLLISEGKDPFVFVIQELDKELSERSKAAYQKSLAGATTLWKKLRLDKESVFPAQFSFFWMALVCAAKDRLSPKSKASSAYFFDLQHFLRILVTEHDLSNDSEQGGVISYGESLKKVLSKAAHALVFAPSNYSHFLPHIDSILAREKGKKGQKEKERYFEFLEALSVDYDTLYDHFRQFPSGPLFKILDHLQGDRETLAFDPFMEGNLPTLWAHIKIGEVEFKLLHSPSPTHQRHLSKATLVPEWQLSVDEMGYQKEKLLVAQFQDRTSNEEYARAHALENASKQVSYQDHFALVTLPKRGSFYNQSEEFAKMGEAARFLSAFEDQITHAADSGFFASPLVGGAQMLLELKKMPSQIHEAFFEGKINLSRKERLDLIAFFELFAVMYALLKVQPTHLCLLCKDGVDLSASTLASLFTLLKWLSGAPWKEEDFEVVRQMLFGPAIKIRERLMESGCFHRSLSLLHHLGAAFLEDPKGAARKVAKIFGTKELKSTFFDL